MKRAVFALVTAFVMLFSGCSFLLETERLDVRAYEWNQSDEGEPAGEGISNYAAMRAAIKRLVDTHTDSGELIFSSYDGDAREDLYRAIADVQSNTALGAYSVEYMSPVPQQIVSFFRAELNITYKRTKQEVDDIVSLDGGLTSLPDAVGEMMKSAESYKAFRIITSAASVSEIEALLGSAYPSYILDCPVRPEVSVGVCPESGVEKIVEISLNYGYTPEELALFRDELRAGLAAFDGLGEETDAAHLAVSAAERLAELCRPWTPEDGHEQSESLPPPINTAVSALGRGFADSEGFALAYYTILNALGVECEVVAGALDREPHYWNIVWVDGEYYHFDVSCLASDGPENTCLRNDGDMSGRYFWDMEGYPVCGGSLTYDELFSEDGDAENTT